MCDRRFQASTLLILALVTNGDAADPRSPTYRPFLKAHCLGCHDADARKGGLDLASLADKFDDPAVAARWVRVHDRIAAGEMPPPKKSRPPKAESDAALKSLTDALVAGEKARRAMDGRTRVRRLNRDEFEHTLRDLLDLPGLDVKDLLPEDGRANGYNKSAAALDIGPILLAKYLEAIDKALDVAVAKYSVPPEFERRTLYANHQYDFKILMSGGDSVMLKDQKYDPRFPLPAGTGAYGEKQFFFGGKYKDLGVAERDGAFKEPATVGMFRTLDESFAGRFHFTPLHPGQYRFAISTWCYWWDKGELKPAPRDGAVGLYCGDRLLGHFTAPSLKPTGHEVNVWIDPKPRNYLKIDPASLWPVHLYFSQGQAAGYTGPGVAIDSLTVEGPLHDEWPPTSHRRLFGNLPVVPFHKLPSAAPRPKRAVPTQLAYDAMNGAGRLVFGTVVADDPPAYATRLLADFLPRAFRRPVAPDEVSPYAAIARGRLAAGASFEDAMLAAYRTALCSPEFLFLREPVGPLDNWALASRLSYFLWNSMPDDTLIDAARTGKLREGDGLRKQVDRMLNDPRIERFVADFLDQWLDLRDIDATTPDRALYPEFQPYLQDAIRQEPRAFFKHLLASNHHAREIIRSSFLTLNQRLAEHYGMPKAVSGTAFKVVGVPPGSHRGGLLTQAAILKVTANGTVTSPVKRGTWVQRKIVGKPPDPPPPDVPAIEPDVRGTTTIRELLAKHRDNAACAGCHAKIDPPGFALESFDVIGGWRDRYRATGGKDLPDFARTFPSHLDPAGAFLSNRYHVAFRLGPPADPSGQTADGKKFAGIDEFRDLLLADPRAVPRNLASQLIAYATGAPVGFADRAAVDHIVERSGGHVRSMLYELVQSPAFLNK